MLVLSEHARHRIVERKMTVHQLAAALAGRCYRNPDGRTIYCDPRTRTAIVVNSDTLRIVTVFRLKRSIVKKHCSR